MGQLSESERIFPHPRICLFVLCLMAFPGSGRSQPPAIDGDAADSPPWMIGVPWYETAPKSSITVVQNSVGRMLKLSWTNSKSGPATARKEFDAAWKLCQTDPRIPYALGLTLWRHGQRADAVPKFDQARTLRGPLFPAAHQAAIWCRFTQGDRRGAIENLQHFADRLQAATVEINDDYRIQLYDWLGAMHAFAVLQDESQQFREALEKLAVACQPPMVPGAALAFSVGGDRVREIGLQLLAESQRTDEDIREELRPQLDRATEELQEVSTQLLDERKSLADIRNDAKVADSQKDLKNRELRRAINENQKNSASLAASFAQLSAQESAARSRMSTTTKAVQKTVQDGYETIERTIIDKDGDEKTEKIKQPKYKTVTQHIPKTPQELAADRAHWEHVKLSLVAVQQQADVLQDRLETSEQEAKQAREIAMVRSKDARLISRKSADMLETGERRRKELEAQIAEWTAQIAKPEKYRTQRRDERRSIATYVDWDFESERQCVLTSFKSSVLDPTP